MPFTPFSGNAKNNAIAVGCKTNSRWLTRASPLKAVVDGKTVAKVSSKTKIVTLEDTIFSLQYKRDWTRGFFFFFLASMGQEDFKICPGRCDAKKRLAEFAGQAFNKLPSRDTAKVSSSTRDSLHKPTYHCRSRWTRLLEVVRWCDGAMVVRWK